MMKLQVQLISFIAFIAAVQAAPIELPEAGSAVPVSTPEAAVPNIETPHVVYNGGKLLRILGVLGELTGSTGDALANAENASIPSINRRQSGPDAGAIMEKLKALTPKA
ncbi:hypothetical protein BKA70DRAFT_1437869 [Coprinopsis sp. MPI-PUGE-AT-0042]|nr:hypothetical protein BKA70DRAFT_1437869 [Coprinopsis sp. MPI-PUGE-AT-0042]